MKLTIIADENIAGLDDYFCHHPNVRLIKCVGRDILSKLDQHKPDALFIRSVTPINATTLKRHVPFIASATLGLDHIDQDFLHKQNISFAHAQGSSKHSVAQYVITAILQLCPHYLTATPTLGIIGLGNIGSTLARYADDLGWHVRGFDPFLSPSATNNCSFDDVLASDIISIHTPLTKTGTHPTHQLINRQTLDKINKNSLLINAARGKVVDGKALLDDLIQTQRTVVLDVFPDEPIVSSALLDRLAIATPHIAGYTLDGKIKGTDMIYQAFCRHFDLPICQSLDNILPANPHTWQDLKNNPSQLPHFYDIMSDDQRLRQACVGGQVSAMAFDKLRKNYPLKREWRFDAWGWTGGL